MSAPGAASEIPAGTLMQGKRGLIMGVANNRSRKKTRHIKGDDHDGWQFDHFLIAT